MREGGADRYSSVHFPKGSLEMGLLARCCYFWCAVNSIKNQQCLPPQAEAVPHLPGDVVPRVPFPSDFFPPVARDPAPPSWSGP